MEYNHMAELGLSEDKQLLCTDTGFITRNNPVRDLCERFVRDGGRLYDLLSRYETVVTYTLSRDEDTKSAAWMMIPFLKANGATDEDVYRYSRERMSFMPDAPVVMNYLTHQLPTYIASTNYEQSVLSLAEMTGFPIDHATYNSFSFDGAEMDRKQARRIKEAAEKLNGLRLSGEMYTVSGSRFLCEEDADLMALGDEYRKEILPELDIYEGMTNAVSVSSSDEALALLEIIRKTGIGTDETAVIGCRASDYETMDLVKDSSGLAISFNGDEYAVRGSNIAVIGDHPITAAVLVNEFYNGGIESVFEMADGWSREYLEKHSCCDRNLMNRFLETFPKKLPKVYRVTKKNASDVINESAASRRKSYDPRRFSA